jgi:putative transferase (TIGR04331 family)
LIDSKSEWFDETNIVFQQVLEQVSSNLNEIHSVNYSNRYWNIFVGPWLQQFVDMVMIRLRDIEKLDQIPPVDSETRPSASLREFNQRSKTSIFVESLHADVLAQLNTATCPTADKNRPNNGTLRHIYEQKLGRTYISATYLPRPSEVLLQFRFGRLPQLFKKSQFAVSKNIHEHRILICKTSGSMTINAQRILALLKKYMPSVYIEEFKSLQYSEKPWKSKNLPGVIFTANRHLYDDVFNYWAATASEHGSRLVFAQHGGNYGISEFPSFSERHENLVADRYITWGWDSMGPTYKGFAMPLIGRALHSSQPNGPLLVITDQLWKYPRSIFSDTPESSTYLDHLK